MLRLLGSRNLLLTLGFSCLSAVGFAADEKSDKELAKAVEGTVKSLVRMQEGDNDAEWPYEGVYRVSPYEKDFKGKRQIPMGYRVGGSSIVCAALILAPDYAKDKSRKKAIEKATGFVVEAINHPLMSPEYGGGYDVRGWGYIYALDFLLLMERMEIVPEDYQAEVGKAITWYLSSLALIEIPTSGGWNYARRGPLDKASSTSPFMTGPAVQVLFAAKQQGHKVDPAMIDRALGSLERARQESGEVVYSSNHDSEPRMGQLPGSVGRMLVTENSLLLGGRGSLSGVRGALDSFLVHWDWLDQRRAQTGTHVAPYGVAPYYFYYAHFQAAQAIELLPEKERAEYRRRLHELLFRVQQKKGTWNDRVFDRTANYGSSIALRVLTMPECPEPARWSQ